MLPELNAPPSAADVCVVLSLFTHVTVSPRDTVIGFGLYAVVVRVLAPATMVMPEPDGVGEGLDGLDGVEEYPPPQPASPTANVASKKSDVRIVPVLSGAMHRKAVAVAEPAKAAAFLRFFLRATYERRDWFRPA